MKIKSLIERHSYGAFTVEDENGNQFFIQLAFKLEEAWQRQQKKEPKWTECGQNKHWSYYALHYGTNTPNTKDGDYYVLRGEGPEDSPWVVMQSFPETYDNTRSDQVDDYAHKIGGFYLEEDAREFVETIYRRENDFTNEDDFYSSLSV